MIDLTCVFDCSRDVASGAKFGAKSTKLTYITSQRSVGTGRAKRQALPRCHEVLVIFGSNFCKG